MPETDTHLHYLRAKKGGGRLYDESEADAATFLDRRSRARQGASIWRSHIEGSEIVGGVTSDAIVRASSVLHTIVHGASIDNSVVACEFVGQNARIRNSEVTGKTRVSGAVLDGVRVANVTEWSEGL